MLKIHEKGHLREVKLLKVEILKTLLVMIRYLFLLHSITVYMTDLQTKITNELV